MGIPKFILDSNAIIDFLGNKLPPFGMEFMCEIVDQVPNISVISKIEVLGFKATDEQYQFLLDFMNDSIILELTAPIIEDCIAIRKKHRTKLPDAIIAATARMNNLVIVSRNVNDFKNIENIHIVNPHEI